MQYALLIYQGENWPSVPTEEKNRVHAACGAWHETLVRSGHARAAFGLQPIAVAKTVRGTRDQVLVSDGPFAETKEVLGGLEIVECRDFDEALDLARRFPALRGGHCTVEVRPLVGPEGCRD